MGELHFDPIPETPEEAVEIGKALSVTALTGKEATETAIREQRAPRVLHLATHGFFLPDQPTEPEDRGLSLGIGPSTSAFGTPPPAAENPLLRSGLALAGANRRAGSGDDGILTALEMAGLDLWGTELVVLSACETAVGEVAVGEGVYGLRRALVIAGAESQLGSLWKVSDEATRELMTRYYERLIAGEGRAEALRRVQLEMIQDRALRHPFYWASFIPIGAWDPLAPAAESASPE